MAVVLMVDLVFFCGHGGHVLSESFLHVFVWLCGYQFSGKKWIGEVGECSVG